MSYSPAGKGDGHRPTMVSREEHELRKRYAYDPDFNIDFCRFGPNIYWTVM